MSDSGLIRSFFLLTLISLIFLLPQMNGQIAITPSSVAFGNVAVGNSQTKALSITNTGSSNVNVSSVSVNGNGYAGGALNLPYTLSPGQTMQVNVTFAPPAAGTDGGSVYVTGYMQGSHYRRWRSRDTSTSAKARLSGTGVSAAAGQIAASPATLSFGSILPGQSQTLVNTLTNTGNASVTISGAGLSNSAFAVGGLSLPATLPAGQSVTFNVIFSPTTSGTISGTLTILSNASDA